jgi:hypothetical protein
MRLSLSTLELFGYFASRTGLFERAPDKVTCSFSPFSLFKKSPTYRYCASVTSFQVRLYHIFELAIKPFIQPLLSSLQLSLHSTYKSNILAY